MLIPNKFHLRYIKDPAGAALQLKLHFDIDFLL